MSSCSTPHSVPVKVDVPTKRTWHSGGIVARHRAPRSPGGSVAWERTWSVFVRLAPRASFDVGAG
jgi:hypothetical protein